MTGEDTRVKRVRKEGVERIGKKRVEGEILTDRG